MRVLGLLVITGLSAPPIATDVTFCFFLFAFLVASSFRFLSGRARSCRVTNVFVVPCVFFYLASDEPQRLVDFDRVIPPLLRTTGDEMKGRGDVDPVEFVSAIAILGTSTKRGDSRSLGPALCGLDFVPPLRRS